MHISKNGWLIAVKLIYGIQISELIKGDDRPKRGEVTFDQNLNFWVEKLANLKIFARQLPKFSENKSANY